VAIELTTDRLRIRDVEISDFGDLLAHRCSDSYREHVPSGPPMAESIAAVINRALLNQVKEPRTSFLFIAVDRNSGRFVGEASLKYQKVDLAAGRNWLVGQRRPDRTGVGHGNRIGAARVWLRSAGSAPHLRSMPCGKCCVASDHGEIGHEPRRRSSRKCLGAWRVVVSGPVFHPVHWPTLTAGSVTGLAVRRAASGERSCPRCASEIRIKRAQSDQRPGFDTNILNDARVQQRAGPNNSASHRTYLLCLGRRNDGSHNSYLSSPASDAASPQMG
jgi:hypothetical protein